MTKYNNPALTEIEEFIEQRYQKALAALKLLALFLDELPLDPPTNGDNENDAKHVSENHTTDAVDTVLDNP